VVAAVLLASCGGGANGDAIATCHGVNRALVAYDRSLVAPTPTAAAADLATALHDVALVQHAASMANSADGSYNALMTLVQQAQELPFADVAAALRSACASVTSPTGGP
jgi:prophage DNA circulation protein